MSCKGSAGHEPRASPAYYWREHQRESGPIGASSIVSMPSNATLMRAAGLCATGAASTKKTAFLAADPGVVG